MTAPAVVSEKFSNNLNVLQKIHLNQIFSYLIYFDIEWYVIEGINYLTIQRLCLLFFIFHKEKVLQKL